jgi:hypothetical protein
MNKLTFSTVTYADLRRLVDLSEEVDDSQFAQWMGSSVLIEPADEAFLSDLATRHRKNIDAYSEAEVKAKLIIPILNRIDFTVNGYTDWYERPLHAQFGDTELLGTTDYFIARGEKEPLEPVFFIQEFKPAFTNKSPEVQLVAEMLVAFQSSSSAEMRGAYVTGSIWKFVLMRRFENKFVYYVSQSLDCLRHDDATQIYTTLQTLRQQLATSH